MTFHGTQCPDWQDLAAMRRDPAAADAADAEDTRWDAALDHAAGCGDCGPRAVAADPLALLRPLQADVAALESDMDVERMLASVDALRRGQRAQKEKRFTATTWMRYAAAAAFAVTLVGLGVVNEVGVGDVPGTGPQTTAEVIPAATMPDTSAEPMPWDHPLDAFAVPAENYAEFPVFDDLQRPAAASIYQLAEDDMHVVMVVHETLDV